MGEHTPRTVVSVLRLRSRVTTAGHMGEAPMIDVDATMSDGSRAVLFRTRADAADLLEDSEIVGLTAQQAYELAEERGLLP